MAEADADALRESLWRALEALQAAGRCCRMRRCAVPPAG
jgi:hypothetical protein